MTWGLFFLLAKSWKRADCNDVPGDCPYKAINEVGSGCLDQISGKDVIPVLSDDTDVFVLLIYWVFRRQLKCKIQIERWDRTVLDINATCANLVSETCLQLLGMHGLSGCDTASYPFGKGKATALKILLRVTITVWLMCWVKLVLLQREDLIEAAGSYFIALYGQSPGTSLQSARFQLFASKKKSPKVMALPPTSSNLLQHALRAHLQIILWKAADQHSPPEELVDITRFGWGIQG